MPSKSQAQNRFFHWAAEHPQESGVKPSVSADFLAADHGRKIKDLPQHVQHKAEGGSVAAGVRPRFKW